MVLNLSKENPDHENWPVSGNCVTCYKEYFQLNGKKFSRKYYTNNRIKIRQSQKRYWDDPKNKHVIHAALVAERNKRRLREEQNGGSFTAKEWRELKIQYDHRCLCCGRHESELDEALEADHVIPIIKGGTGFISNIQPLCKPCNGSGGKGANTTDYRVA